MPKFLSLAVVGFFIWANIAQAQMTSTNYEIRWDTISTGGSDTASSATYQLRDTIESSLAGRGSSVSYVLDQGYRSGFLIDVIDFSLMVQDVSSEVSVTSLSGTTITVSTTGISVDDYVLIVQDKGESQVSAIGKVESVGSGSIEVDFLKDGGTTPVIDGTDDFLYVMNASTLALGSLSVNTVTTGVIGWEVNADLDNGYVVQVFEDGDFRSGSDVIADVTDGAVSVGGDEYGARSSDTSLTSTFDTEDSAISTVAKEVASESGASFQSRNFLTIKAAPSDSTVTGNYAHTISLIASGNF
jgi:hypothetical protein